MPARLTGIYRFAEFELNGEALELTRNGKRIRLQIQPFRVLELLLERAGDVVTRDEFRARVWPSNVYVDFDHGLNNAITRLREALGDSADNPRYIETMHRVGYRFVCPIHPEHADAPRSDPVQPDVSEPAETRSRPSWRVLAPVALLVAAAAAATLLVTTRDVDDPHAAPIRSIAVLQFRDLSNGDAPDYFAAGMTEALITRLAQNDALRVVSRRAAARHQDVEKPVADIARDLQVDAVVEGSIVRQGARIRLDVRLVRAADESHAWAQSYERAIEDVFQLQRELANDIGSAIDADVGGAPGGPVSVARSDNVEAYELYLQGRHLWNQRSRESVDKSLEYYRKAIQLDPDFAAAHAGIARAHASQGGHTLVQYLPAKDLRVPAMAAAQRAIELDPRLAEAHLALAAVLNHLFPQSAETDAEIEREMRLALELDPASADARHSYGNFLSTRRRSEEAVSYMREAMLLDPLSPNIVGRLGSELATIGQVDEGIELMRRAVELEPWQFNAHLRLGWAYAALDRHEEALGSFAAAEQVSPGSAHTLSGRSYVAARSGDTAGAAAALGELRAQAEASDSPFLVAIVYVALQDREGAIHWLQRTADASAVTLRPGSLYGLDRPIYDWLRDDDRFRRIAQSVEGT